MIYLVYRMKLAAQARQDLKAFWAWLEARELWFYRDLPMVKGLRWFQTVIGEPYTLECWAAFADEAALGAYRKALASLKCDAEWERQRVSQDAWWEFLESRLVADVPSRVGFGAMGAAARDEPGRVP